MRPTSLAILIYDPHCPRCESFAHWGRRWSLSRLEIVSYETPGAMDLHPDLNYSRAIAEPQIILANGYLCQGAEAVTWVLGSRPGFGLIPVLYRFPLVRPLANLLYWALRARPTPCDSCP